MQRIHKILAICLLLTALVFGVLKILGGVGMGAKGRGGENASSRDSMTRHERGEGASVASTRKLRQRARKMTSAEATEFLKTTIIPRVEFNDILLSDALKILNAEITKETPVDQLRPSILMEPKYREQIERESEMSIDDVHARSIFGRRVIDIRALQMPTDSLLKLLCYQTHSTYWFYKGDFYLSANYNNGGLMDYFYHSEKLERVQFTNIDASQLTEKWNEIIGDHDYFGPKQGMDVMMTKRARDALLKGEIELPRIDLDLENVTSREVLRKIAEHTDGTLILNEPNLLFNPFNEEAKIDPFAAVGEGFDIPLNEDTMNPDFVPFEDPFE